MAELEQTVFEKYVDDQGSFLTSCSLEDNPEVVIAVMGENLADDYPNPEGFEKKCQSPCHQKFQVSQRR